MVRFTTRAKNSTRGVEKTVSNSAQYREWLSYLVSGMARAVTNIHDIINKIKCITKQN
jgi:hypothetical protein